MGYGDYLSSQGGDKSRVELLLALARQEPGVEGFLRPLDALRDTVETGSGDPSCPFVLSTIHASKGLEYDRVFLIDAVDGIFPSVNPRKGNDLSDEERGSLEEERRLCYVAMTRAREKLVMTNARQRMLYGRTSANKSSRFLDEIPAEDMRWESKPEPKFGTYDEDGFGGSRWGDDFGGGSFGGSSYSGSSGRSGGYVSGGVHTYKSTKPAAQTLRTSSRGSTPAAPSVGLIQLSQGDQVEHTAFGKGSVVSVKPMGGDALAEVAFESGTKKLMLKSAGKHMKKL